MAPFADKIKAADDSVTEAKKAKETAEQESLDAVKTKVTAETDLEKAE